MHRLGRRLFDPQHHQVVAQLGTHQEFRREVSHRFAGLLAQGLNARQVAGHQPIAHRIAKRHIKVMAAGIGSELAQGEKQVLGDAGK